MFGLSRVIESSSQGTVGDVNEPSGRRSSSVRLPERITGAGLRLSDLRAVDAEHEREIGDAISIV